MNNKRIRLPAALLAVLSAMSLVTSPPAAAQEAAGADGGSPASAEELARRTIERMGGEEAWRETRYLRWNFKDLRRHAWDRHQGRDRIESDDLLILLDLRTREGRAFSRGEGGLTEITDPAARAEALRTGYAWWVNDSYWLIMPFKLLDPGAHLRLIGEDDLPDGRRADLLELTFDPGVGLTPENKYRVWIARDNGLVEQWSYYARAEDEEPVFTRPWTGWKRFGRVLIATVHGRGDDWEISAPAELPDSLFEKP